jgi:hypothetical protein
MNAEKTIDNRREQAAALEAARLAKRAEMLLAKYGTADAKEVALLRKIERNKHESVIEKSNKKNTHNRSTVATKTYAEKHRKG